MAGFFAQTFGAKVCLLNIQSDEQGDKHSVEGIRQAFEKACASAGLEVGGDACVRTRDAEIPEGIRRTAIEEAADLVIVGRGHARKDFSRAWSHLYEIIRESPSPVLSV